MDISISDTSTYTSRSSSPTPEPIINSTPKIHHHNHKINPSIHPERKISGNLSEKQAEKLDQKQKNSSAMNTKNTVEPAVKGVVECIAKCALFIAARPIKYLAIAIQKIVNICMATVTTGLVVIYGILLFAPWVLLNVLLESIVQAADRVP